ncbi:MAG TPA: hydantoinase/oxoprolinase family protein [Alphaproteobacteria bacterium]
MSLRAGVDVGGTFTDVVLLDEATGALTSAKVPTDYDDPINPIVNGLVLVAGAGNAVAALHHATTLATNAIIEGKLPRGLLLTTRGFRDVLDIGRIQRPAEGIYDFNIDNPLPLVPRERRIEVNERIGARGEVVETLDEDDLRRKLRPFKGKDVRAVAVCGLFSFVNPAHERRIGEIVAEELPGVHVSLSCDVSPEIREFERSSTVVLDALLKPIQTPYLKRLSQRLGGEGVDATRIMMASGGLAIPDLAADKPVTMINSGPAAGVIASANLGRQIDAPDLVTIDMGGTSLDIGIVEGGRPVHKFEGSIAGYPVRTPMIDVAAVAAGGGSLALVDHVGYIQVDRESAGSVPGPACYGRGGQRPTITDADVVLGRLGTELGGRGGFTLKPELAQAAFADTIGELLAVDVPTAAASSLDIIQARMVKAIAANTLEKGLDLRALPLLIYGGAGPTHGIELAEALGMRRAIVPYLAGNFSAVGLLLCPLRWDESQMVLRPAAALDAAVLARYVSALDDAARGKLHAAGARTEGLTTRWLAHMRYAGQSYDLAIDLGEAFTGRLPADAVERLVRAFHDQHERRYAYRSESEVVEIVQVRVSVEGEELPYPKPTAPKGPARHAGRRPVYFTRDRKTVDTAVWDRATLPVGAVIDGPAVIEGEGSSALIPSGWRATVDEWLNLDVRKN